VCRACFRKASHGGRDTPDAGHMRGPRTPVPTSRWLQYPPHPGSVAHAP